MAVKRKDPRYDWTKHPIVHCSGCGRELPRIAQQPFPVDLVLRWSKMILIERRLIAGLVLDHIRREPYRIWRGLDAAKICNMTYRQVHNAIRRLVPTGWVIRLDGARGRYRLSSMAVETLSRYVTGSHLTLKTLQETEIPDELD